MCGSYVSQNIDSLYSWIKKENSNGWDPYDGLNSSITKSIAPKSLKIIFIQMNKFSPVNLRPILQIKKGLDLKGISIIAQANYRLFKITNDYKYLKELQYLTSIIVSNSLYDKYEFHCWASHYFPYMATDKSEMKEISPDIIGTSQAIIALLNGYELLGEQKLKDVAFNASSSLIEHFVGKNSRGLFLKYTLGENDKIVLNASAQGLEAFSYVLNFNKDNATFNTCEALTEFLMETQNGDGSWIYSIYKNGKTRVQLDFHQGYILDGLLSFIEYSKNEDALNECINAGADYYRKMFQDNGKSFYRYPMRFPVDIHNQAQGIITFCRLNFINQNYQDFAKKIASWTVNNMQDPTGYFYYQKWPFFINKIPYMRWSQAWMLLALSYILEQAEDSDNNEFI